jgi:hypothetical protein
VVVGSVRRLRLLDPMLSRSGPLTTDQCWSFELKWDGFRALVSTETGWASSTPSVSTASKASSPNAHQPLRGPEPARLDQDEEPELLAL